MTMKLRLGVVLSSLMILITACYEDNQFQPDFSDLTLFKVRMTDAPLDVEEVNIDLKSVIVLGESGQRDTLDSGAGIYNLLDLQGGVFADIGSGILDFNFVREVRLVLGEENTIKVAGEVFTLIVPSSATSGLKLKTCIDLSETSDFVLDLDFDAEKSVHQQGTGDYILRPVIKVLNEGARCGGNPNGGNEGDDDGEDDDGEDDDGLTFEDLPEDAQSYLGEEYTDYEFEVEEGMICGMEGLFFKVTAGSGSEEVFVYFDGDGNFIQEESIVNAADMPGMFQQIISMNYPSYQLDGEVIYMIKESQLDETVTYKLPLVKNNGSERITIIIDGDGTILCETVEEA